MNEEESRLVSLLLMGSLAALVTYFAAQRGFYRIDDADRQKRSIARQLLFGAATWFICYPVVIFFHQLWAILIESLVTFSPVDQIAVQSLKSVLGDRQKLLLALFTIVIVAPLFEESIFRGLLQRFLRTKIGVLKAVASTSLLFAGFHYAHVQGWYNLELLPSLFILSCYLGFLYEKRQSLWASIGLHATFNLISAIGIIYEIA